MPDLAAALHEHFGFAAFRAGQEEVVSAAVAGRDTLAIMPTGAGKSLTYELAAMLREAPTLVLSPLIALMKDQVDHLPPSIAATAAFVNSSLGPEVAAERLRAVAEGRIRLLFAAPERLRQARFVDTLRQVGLGLVVVDEVHCVSMWGHDFRPDYLFIRDALETLGSPCVLGLTATATPAVEAEIGRALGREPASVRTTVVRPNLRYDVQPAANADERLDALLDRLRRADGGSAIVYARSRRSTESLALVLRGHGFRAEAYHAGLEAEERGRVQEAFVSGRTRVVVATTAFGMGIDKPDVRLVALVNHPDSLEGYVQMVGRAGRDGRPSDTLLLAGDADAAALRRFALAGVPSLEDLRRAYRVVRDARGLVDPEDISQHVPGRDPRVLVGLLDQAGIVRRGYDDGRLMRVQAPPQPADASTRVDEILRRLSTGAAERAERIIAFARTGGCRHRQVAEYFGETLPGPCDACDVCAPRSAAPAPRPAAPLPDDVGATILAAVRSLRWPLGRRSLVAMLRGSAAAPPSARRSPFHGALAGAGDADVNRWIKALERCGALVPTDTDDGFRVLLAPPGAKTPRLVGPAPRAPDDGEADDACADALREWRRQRARADGIPPFVILHDATIRLLAAGRPRTLDELAAVRGFGPAKIERYGAEVLDVCAGTLRS